VAETFPIEFGEYRLLKKLAQGGMAEIFLAQDKRGAICALKRILPHLAHEESFIRMFIDEARIVSHLDHPNIAGVYDQGKHAGYYYIAMEFVQGHSLLAVSERAKSMKIPLPRGLLSYIVGELLGGLGCAHSARDAKGRHLGIVHRDVTPQNVIISYDGDVKLIDFGVAKARARLTQTEAGFTKGKLSYMSPEQARGEELDARSDLFSVGIILYEITTNTRLFNKEGPGGILGAIVNDPVPPPTLKVKNFPKQLESIVMKGLEKDVHRRWQSAEEMREALMRYARNEQPAPGKQRLKDLIYDLFGAPESQKEIEQAKAAQEPTPEEAIAHGAPVRASIKGRTAADDSDPGVVPAQRLESIDETRMMRPDYDVAPSGMSRKVEVTSDGTPIVQIPIPAGRVSVPEPKVPTRVKLARFLEALASDLRVSWRQHRARWIGIAFGSTGMLLLMFAWLVIGFGRIGGWMADTAQSAREIKQSAGLSDESFDAGLRPTVLRLSSDPPGAHITIDGVGMGMVTPADLVELPTGRALEIELSLAGYRVGKDAITLFPDQGTKEISVTLEKQAGGLLVRSEPDGATITIDGQKKGPAPQSIEGLTAGRSVTVRATKKGYKSASTIVQVPDGEVRDVLLTLDVDQMQIPGGRLSVKTSPPGCAIFVDDGFVGNSPLGGLDKRPGSYQVKAECENYGAESRTVIIDSGKTAEISFAMKPTVFGYLTIRPVPAQGTVISINGQRVSLPVEFLKVIPGRHDIVCENRSLNAKKALSIDVPANARINRDCSLVQ
jgi:eukaryotic-like serine/threonine-protein kinase